jgi:hypothetical protein
MRRVTLVLLLAAVALIAPAHARAPIHEILAKGGEWALNVDGHAGVLRVTDGQTSPGQGGGWAVTLDVTWDERPGTLEGRSFGDEQVQAVTLNLTGPDGAKVSARGYIARESADFMAGFSTYKTGSRDVNGAWYATRMAAPPGAAEGRVSPGPPTGPDTAVPPGPAPGDSADGAAAASSPEADAAGQQAAVRLCRMRGTVTGRLELVAGVAAFALESGERIATVRPQSDGSFALEPLPDGRYRLTPIPAGPFELVVAPQLRRIECVGSQDHPVEFQVLGTVEAR